ADDAVLGDELHQRPIERRAIALVRDAVELGQRALDRLELARPELADVDLRVLRLVDVLLVDRDLLEQLLARADPREPDLDVAIGIEPGEADEVAREVDDL